MKSGIIRVFVIVHFEERTSQTRFHGVHLTVSPGLLVELDDANLT